VLAWREALAARNQLHELEAGNKKELMNRLDEAIFSTKGIETSFEIPKIYYASRTHSQLSQVMKELKNTSYKPIVSVLGSRDQLCIHEEVYKAPSFAKKGMCRAKVSKKACSFYAGAKIKKSVDAIMDIEELASYGKKQNACPYYLSKEIQSSSDIIFLPYNYLIDANARKAQNIDVKNSIIIFDEGAYYYNKR
jgi:regulator of telomere elongation helicase 1